MKKIATIITILTIALGAYAQDLKTQETLVAEYSAIVSDDKDAQNTARQAYISINLASLESIYNSLIAKIPSANEAWLNKPKEFAQLLVDYANYIALDESQNYSFKVATIIYGNGKKGQLSWINTNGMNYDSLKADGFVYDGWKLFESNVCYLAILNKDYDTYKTYSKLMNAKGISFIKSKILSMSDSTEAYEETKFWENKFVLTGDNEALKSIQDLQDILYLRLMRDNKIK